MRVCRCGCTTTTFLRSSAAVSGPNAGYMFMFRSRRATLTKRLLKARKQRSGSGSDSSDDGVARLLKELHDNQLGMLWAAVESRGRDASSCVLLPKERQPHVLCCQTWRWPELAHGADLRRLPGCRSNGDQVYVCCNPYHWSRVYQPGEISQINYTYQALYTTVLKLNLKSARLNDPNHATI